MQKNTFIYAFVLMANISSVYAFDLSSGLDFAGKLLNGAKAQIDNQIEINKKNAEAAKAIEKQKTQTLNSRYLIQATSNPGVHWVMAKIKLGEKVENVVFKNDTVNIQKMISLRFGPGIYSITLFQSNDEQEYRSSYTYISTFDVENKDQRDLSYLLPSEEIQSDDQRIIDLSNQITASAQTDIEKVRAIHDYVANLVSYDYDSLIGDKYKNNPMDAISVLEHPLTVCSGYSSLTAALIRAAGIRVRIIHGKAKVSTGFGDHAWNEVFINSEWKSLDVTWDDMDPIRYDYFLIDESSMISDHHKESVLENY